MKLLLTLACLAILAVPAQARVISTAGLTCLTLPGGAQYCTNPPAAGATTTITWNTGSQSGSVTITNGVITKGTSP